MQQFPFISCKVLGCKLKIGKATCLHMFHNDLHLEKFNLRHIPHSLKADQKRSRVEPSRELLQILERDQQNEFGHISIKDESWFFLNIFIIRAGPQIQMTCLKFQGKKVQSEKYLISIIWGGTGIKSLLYVPKGMK
jgi:hypothetical protein